MSWVVFAASCVAAIAGMQMAEMALVISGLGGMCVALVMMSRRH